MIFQAEDSYIHYALFSSKDKSTKKNIIKVSSAAILFGSFASRVKSIGIITDHQFVSI